MNAIATDLKRESTERPSFVLRLCKWWFGTDSLAEKQIRVSGRGVLSKPSQDILESDAAGRQLEDFIKLAKEKHTLR